MVVSAGGGVAGHRPRVLRPAQGAVPPESLALHQSAALSYSGRRNGIEGPSERQRVVGTAAAGGKRRGEGEDEHHSGHSPRAPGALFAPRDKSGPGADARLVVPPGWRRAPALALDGP